MERKRIDWVDSIKGFVMLSVVLGHIVNGLYDAGMYSEASGLLRNIQNIVDMYQMPIFAIASGFLFEKAYWKGTELNKNRFKHQLINNVLLYFIWDTIFCVIKLFFAAQANNGITVSHLLLLPFKAVGPFWYFYILVEFYTVFGIRRIHNTNPIAVLSVCVMFGLAGSYFRIFEVRWFEYASFMFYSGFFYIGIIFAGQYKNKIFNRFSISVLGLIAIVLIVINWSSETEIYNIPFVSYFVAVGLSFILVTIFEYIGKVPGLGFIGKHCIEIYTMHIFLTSSGRILLRKLNIGNVYLAILIIYILSIILPSLIAFVMKKIKLYDIFYKPYDCLTNNITGAEVQ